MLKDIIEVSKGFQSSINIEYDFNDFDKISGFIPTSSALSVINNILINTQTDNTERAKILTGAYGRGKSHIVLVSLSILYNKDKNIFKKLLEKLKTIDTETYKRVDNFISSGNRLLPVIINGNSGNLTQAFLGALQQALKLYELEDIMPETHFKAAVNVIDKWKLEFPDTYSTFSSMIEKNVDQFRNMLLASDIESYKKFDELYPKLTSGSIFNPFVGFNVVEIYDKVNTALKEKGFSGMYVVYDEFGKYLESSMSAATESETKMLQDFAEKCNRESSQQLHLMLICHKDISNYIDSELPQDKIDGWRGISGRFEHINLSNDFSQMYEIISCAIAKNGIGWKKYVDYNSNLFLELLETSKKRGFLSQKEDLVVYGCYPLHPVTTFILPRLSEKIAQNERTLFTYLTSNQKNTLREFVLKEEKNFPLVTPDCLYDYFEQELHKELNSTQIYKVYSLSARVLNKVSGDILATKIIKTIAIIYFVEQFECIAPTVEMICEIFNHKYNRKAITDTINFLINNAYIVYRKNSNSFLCLKESSGTDINKEILNRTEKLKSTIDVETAFNFCAKDNYFYPVKHNEHNYLTRYFEFKFISYTNFVSKSYDAMPTGASGIVYAVFFENKAEFSTAEFRIDKVDEIAREVIIVPKKYEYITDNVYKYLATVQLRAECGVEDKVLQSEYDIVIEDLENIVSGYISNYIRPELYKSKYYYNGELQNIKRKSNLSELLSNICDEIYPYTPLINNESLNKDVLPSVAINSRTKLTTALLEKDIILKNLGLSGSGQDVSFMRSTLIRTGILKKRDNDDYFLDTEDCEKSVKYILETIQNFFLGTIEEGEKSFKDLYNQLTNHNYGIGMKKGAIPVYVAVVLNRYKKDLIFKCNGNETRISSDTLNRINEKPEHYSVMMENWNTEKSEYLKNMELIFQENIVNREKVFDSFSYIFNAMVRWYISLPKCAKEMTVYYDTQKKLEVERLKFINSLKNQTSNARQYLIEQIPEFFDQKTVGVVISDNIKRTKEIFDNGKALLLLSVIEETKKVFNGKKESSIASVLNDWYETLTESTKQNLFPNNENAILKLIETVTNDENVFSERIAKAVTGLRIDDWNNDILKRYIENLNKFKKTIDEYNKNSQRSKGVSKNKRYKIVVVDEQGNENVKSFEKVTYSARANLLYQDITGAIEDMGQAVTEQEKRQILIEILESLC